MAALLAASLAVLLLPTAPVRGPRVRTPIGASELAAVLRDGHRYQFGRAPSRRRLVAAWAQVALENGQGRECFSFNLGMVGAVADQPYHFLHGHRFRSYADHVEGSRGYWAVMAHHPITLRMFDAGDVAGAARAMAGSYHRTDPALYAARMTALLGAAERAVAAL
jgi:hypothetical protein